MEAATITPECAQIRAAPRYHALDSLRAALMLLGLALHSATSYTTRSLGDAWPYNDGNGSRLFDCIVLYTHLFRMPLFFALSGFFGALVLERRGARELARNRFLRIGLPLLAGWLVTFPFVKSGFVYAVNAGKPNGWHMALASLRSPFAASVSPRFPLTWMHLWFLYYLVLFFAGALLVSFLSARLPQIMRQAGTERVGRAFRRALLSPFRAVWFAVPTFVLLALMPLGILETDPYLNPAPPILAVYALFFGFGWCLYRERDLLDVGAKQAKFAVSLTVPAFLLLLVTALKISPELTIDLPNRMVLAGCGALIVWLLTFALIGLALRHASRPSRIGRYLADASYWLYLTHLPIVVWLVATAGAGFHSLRTEVSARPDWRGNDYTRQL